MKFVSLKKSPNPEKKLRVTLIDEDQKLQHVDFGQQGYDDFTITKNPKQKASYIARHSGMNEDWKKSGLLTAGFWSRWILWNLPTRQASLEDVRKRFDL